MGDPPTGSQVLTMSDVYCLLRLPLPFRVRLNGETWEISHDRAMKSGHHLIKATLWGRTDQERKWYTLYAGRESEVYAALECGFRFRAARRSVG